MALRVVELDPSVIVADANIRFNLIDDRVKALADEIAAEGRVINPVEVTKLPKGEASNGFEYRLYTGHYRLAAVAALNEKGAGMKIPAQVVETPEDKATALKHQVAENVARQDMTPMD